MLLRFTIILSVMVAGLYAATSLKQMQKESRVALVIANGGYDDAPLSYALNEASQMRKFLKQSGFEVIYAENADKRDMIKLLRKFSAAIKPNGVALFYYNGHAVQLERENHLVPLENGITHASHIPRSTIELNSVLKKMKNGDSRLNIVILDAAHPDPFGSTFKPEKIGLARQKAMKGFDFFISLRPGRTSRYRRFTPALLDVIRTKGISNAQSAAYLRDNTPEFAIPTALINPKESFYFNLPDTLSSKADKAWQWTQKKGTLTAYKLFLQIYPKSRYSSIAQLEINKLKAAVK